MIAAVAVSHPAAAQPKTASEWFNAGDNHYNLGEFDKAIEAFRKAFELEKDEGLKPIYLYNIAQAYRQAGDCDNAVFFYKRFLSLKNADTKKPLDQSTRDNIQKRIAEQEKLCAEKNSNRDKPPEGTMRPGEDKGGDKGEGDKGEGDKGEGDKGEGDKGKGGTQVATVDTEDGESEDGDPALRAYLGDQPKVVSLRLGAGVGLPKMTDVDAGAQFAGTVIGGYPIMLAPKVGLDVGAALSLSPFQWNHLTTQEKNTSLFITAVANAGLRIEAVPKLTLRADVGVGALFLTNVAEGNPFTEMGTAAEGGALTMFHLRLGAAAEYAVAQTFTLWASPITFAYSPAKAGLVSDSIIQLSFLAGVGYKM
jgi:hypothetical protein